MSTEGQGHFFTIYFPGYVCFVLYKAKISGERLQDHWSSGLIFFSTDLQTKSELLLKKSLLELIYFLITITRLCNILQILIVLKNEFFSSPEPKAHGELIVYQSSCRVCVCVCVSTLLNINIYILIALALDESIILDVPHFPMQNIYQSCDLGRAIGRRNFNASQ